MTDVASERDPNGRSNYPDTYQDEYNVADMNENLFTLNAPQKENDGRLGCSVAENHQDVGDVCVL
jgi:hypothetical protein